MLLNYQKKKEKKRKNRKEAGRRQVFFLSVGTGARKTKPNNAVAFGTS